MRSMAFRGLRLPRLGAMRGGGGADFNYAAYGTPTFWMDANYLNGTSPTASTNAVDDAVTEWRSRQGAAAPFYRQATGAAKPLLARASGGDWSLSTGTSAFTFGSGSMDQVRHFRLWTDAGGQLTADLVDTHSFLLIYAAGASPVKRNIYGKDDTGVNLQIGVGGSSRPTVVGTPAVWDNSLTGDDALAGNDWYVIEADLRSTGTSTLRVNGVSVATYTGTQGAVNVDVALAGRAATTDVRTLGGQLALSLTYSTTGGYLSSGNRADVSTEFMRRRTAIKA